MRRMYRERPKRGTARKAWDVLSKRGTIKEMWHAWLDYPVWVCEYTNGETDEVESAAFTLEYVPEEHAFMSKRRIKAC